MSRVRIGNCTGPADAAIVRAMLSAHGIEAVVGGELHANMLGGLGGALISLDITVAEEDAEQAVGLLKEFREDEQASSAGNPADVRDADEPDMDAADSSPDLRIEQRKRTGVALLLAFCITFGTAHMYARAWAWGFGLAILEVIAFTRLGQQPTYGAVLFAGCILTDAIGAIWRIRAENKTQLPTARVR